MIRKSFHFLVFSFLILLILGGISVFILAQGLPNPQDFNNRVVPQSTKIYDRTGKILLYNIHGEQRRTSVRLEQISPFVISTTLAAEDATFYHHHGFVLKGIIRASLHNLIHPHDLQGGSTITQQLARNAFLTTKKRITRKIREAILTIEIEHHFSKNQILEMYFNQINYGHNVYGIEAASEFYFNKPAKELTLAEAAYLTAMIKSPSYLSPYGPHRKELEARKNWVLSRVEKLNYYSSEIVEKAKTKKVVFASPHFTLRAPHFVMYIRSLLYDKYGEDEVERGGLKVITTLDMHLQDIAEKLVKKYGDFNQKRIGAQNMSLLAEDPKTGQILAMVGSRDYWNDAIEGKVNTVFSTRQPGSSFKPFVYSTAFKRGFSPNSIVFDVPTNFSLDPKRPYIPTNYDNKNRGPVTFRQALAQSLNVPAVKVLYLAGIKNSIKTAQDFGITTLTKPPDYYGLTLVLGGGGVKLNEMVNGYAAFSQEGIYHPQTSILRIEDSQGNVIEDFSLKSKRVISSQIARLITSILSDNVSRAPTFGWNSPLYFPNMDIAAKTGTDSQYRDAWTLGYSTSLAAGVWAGNNDRSPVAPSGAPGAMLAAPCWHEFMEKASQFYPPQKFTAPLPYPQSKISRPMLNGNYIAQKIYKNINTGETKTVKEIHCALYYINKDNILGPSPKNPAKDPQFWNWEIPVIIWAEENIPNFSQEYNLQLGADYLPENTSTSQSIYFPAAPKIEFISPQNGNFIEGDTKIKVNIETTLPIKRASIYLNQNLLGPLDKENNYYYFILPAQDLKEQNEIKIEAQDSLGQKSSSTIILFKKQ